MQVREINVAANGKQTKPRIRDMLTSTAFIPVCCVSLLCTVLSAINPPKTSLLQLYHWFG